MKKSDKALKMSATDFRKFCDAFRFNARDAGLNKATGAERYKAAALIEQVADRGLIFDFMDFLDCFPCENPTDFFERADWTLKFDPSTAADTFVFF